MSEKAKPEFTLKAWDPCAPALIQQWISLAQFNNVNPEKIRRARAKLQEFLEWRVENGTKKPD